MIERELTLGLYLLRLSTKIKYVEQIPVVTQHHHQSRLTTHGPQDQEILQHLCPTVFFREASPPVNEEKIVSWL